MQWLIFLSLKLQIQFKKVKVLSKIFVYSPQQAYTHNTGCLLPNDLQTVSYSLLIPLQLPHYSRYAIQLLNKHLYVYELTENSAT